MHAEALAEPDDGLVLGIVAGYIQFELNYLGASGSAGQVEAILIYENGARARHLFELQRGGDAWYISRVHRP